MPDHHRILVLGGGTAGITVAARLRRAAAQLDIGIVEPSESHFYQPLWTLVGAGVFPNTAVKCGGAPQKIMYLADDAFRRQGVRDRTQIVFASPAKAIFAVERYRKTLEQVVARKGINTRFRQNLVELRPDAHEAVLEHLDTHERSVVPYDMVHVTPPMSAPDVIKRSPLVNEHGWCAADKFTLRHPKYPEVFALGDAAGLPTSKTGAAIRKQAPVLVHNLLAAMSGKPCDATYDGYTSCPVVTGYGRWCSPSSIMTTSRRNRFQSTSRRIATACGFLKHSCYRGSTGTACSAGGSEEPFVESAHSSSRSWRG